MFIYFCNYCRDFELNFTAFCKRCTNIWSTCENVHQKETLLHAANAFVAFLLTIYLPDSSFCLLSAVWKIKPETILFTKPFKINRKIDFFRDKSQLDLLFFFKLNVENFPSSGLIFSIFRAN